MSVTLPHAHVPARTAAAPDLADLRGWTPVVLAWLGHRRPERVLRDLETARHATLRGLRHVLTTHGLAPLVAELVGTAPAATSRAADTVSWLTTQAAQNRARLARFADDLSAILAAAAAEGVAVMPMKGAVIAFTGGIDAGLRPMADLDLLVRPADATALHAVLERLGYRAVPEPDPRHRVYRRPTDRVVAWDATHPDNPRPIEVHTSVRRTVWEVRDPLDLAPLLWASGRATTCLGSPAVVPSDTALLVDVAWHATMHLMRGTGKALQWVDVARLVERVGALDPRYARYAYPAVALAARVWPTARREEVVRDMSPHAGAALARLVARVALDDRAGLNLRGVTPTSWWGVRWARWRPNPWVVRLAHPRLPTPVAYAAYVAGVAGYAAYRLARPAARTAA